MAKDLEEWQKAMIVQEAPDGTRTFIPLSAAPTIEIRDRGARLGLRVLTFATAAGAVIAAVNEFGDLARDCFNENALWSMAKGVQPVDMMTCLKEGLEWGVLFVRGGK